MKERRGLFMKYISIMFILFLLISPLSSSEIGEKNVIEFFKTRIAEKLCSGVVIGIFENGATRFINVGHHSYENKKPVDERAFFAIGSVTKVFTALLLAKCIQADILTGREKLSYFYPGLKKSKDKRLCKITPLLLASHRSGLARLPSNMTPVDNLDPYAGYSPKQLLSYLMDCKLEMEPGKIYAYSNLGFGLLGYILSKQSKISYSELLLRDIFRPLEMSDAKPAYFKNSHDENIVSPVNQLYPAKHWSNGTLAGCYSIYLTPIDFMKFMQAQFEPPKILKKAINFLKSEWFPTPHKGMSIGIGWHCFDNKDNKIIWHNGSAGGFRSFLGFDDKKRKGVFILSNGTESVDSPALHLLNAKYPLPKIKKSIKLKPVILDKYTGIFETKTGFTFTIKRIKEHLWVKLKGQDFNPLWPESETFFFYRIVPATIQFMKDNKGNIDSIVFQQNGNKTIASRKNQLKNPLLLNGEER
ncbi:serine hydrolase [Candidatus Riflebacteria bacterium]